MKISFIFWCSKCCKEITSDYINEYEEKHKCGDTVKHKDDNIYYESVPGCIYSEKEWKKLFDDSHPCKWYNCDNPWGSNCGPGIPAMDLDYEHRTKCEHPNHFCPKASGLKEVRHYGLDEDGSLMWEEV